MSWDFSPQWGCLDNMSPDYLNNPYSLVNYYSKRRNQSPPDLVHGFNPHAFRRPYPLGHRRMMNPNPYMSTTFRGPNTNFTRDTWRPPRMYPPHSIESSNPVQTEQHNIFAEDGPFDWQEDKHHEHHQDYDVNQHVWEENHHEEVCPSQPQHWESAKQQVQSQSFDVNQHVWGENHYEEVCPAQLHHWESAEQQVQSQSFDINQQVWGENHYEEVCPSLQQHWELGQQQQQQQPECHSIVPTHDPIQFYEIETFKYPEFKHIQHGQSPQWGLSSFPHTSKGPVRRRHQKKKARDPVPYQRVIPTPSSDQTLVLQLKQLADTLQVLSVEWKQEKPSLSSMCVALYDEEAATNVVWLEKPGSYVFTLFGRKGIKLEAYGLSTLSNKKDIYYVSVSGKCSLKVSRGDESQIQETICLKRRTCDRNLLDALVMEDCFTVTQENTVQSFYKLCVVKTDDFITIDEGVLFDTRLSDESSAQQTIGKGSRKRKLSGQASATSSVTSGQPGEPPASVQSLPAASVPEFSAPLVSSEPLVCVVPDACCDSSSTETDVANTTVDPNDISTFLVLDSTLNRSNAEEHTLDFDGQNSEVGNHKSKTEKDKCHLEAHKSDFEGDLGSDDEDERNEKEPPNKKAKGDNKNKTILPQLSVKAEDLFNGFKVTSTTVRPVKKRKKLRAKKRGKRTVVSPARPSNVKTEMTASFDFASKNKPLVTLSTSRSFDTEQSTSDTRTASSCLVAPCRQSSSSSSNTVLPSTVCVATTETTKSIVKTQEQPSSVSTNTPSKFVRESKADTSLTSQDDLEGKEMLLLLRFNRSGKVYFIRGKMKNGAFPITFSLVASEKYEARMFELVSLASSSQPYYSINRVSNYLTFTTQMTQSQLGELQELAEAFIFSNMCKYHRLNHFYRNKPEAYWDDMFQHHNGVMKPYMKDFNGDQGSPINGKLKGLFFSASVNYSNGKIPQSSCFGKKRLYIPGNLLFSKDMCLYFTDFYCPVHSTNGPHYVTLVMTKKGSTADDFCSPRLRLLNPFNNPFLYKQKQNTSWQVFTCTTLATLHVEVFYTEDVDIKTLLQKHKHEVSFEHVATFGKGHSSVRGIPKNPRCHICNKLNQYPISSDL